MPDGQDEIAIEEHVDFAVPDVARLPRLGILDLRGPQDDEERVVVALYLRALVRGQCVLDSQIVESEFFLNFRRSGSSGSKRPIQTKVSARSRTSLMSSSGDLANPPAFRIGDARDEVPARQSCRAHGAIVVAWRPCAIVPLPSR